MKKLLFYLLNFTWCLPQNLIGATLFLFNMRKPHKIYRGAIVTRWKFYGSVSLGLFIFVSRDDKRLLAHEYGHTIQSLILGLFFMLVIGIPSFIWASCFERYRFEHNISYYSFYTEKWANKLVEINLR